jgi:hypothetical protein
MIPALSTRFCANASARAALFIATEYGIIAASFVNLNSAAPAAK